MRIHHTHLESKGRHSAMKDARAARNYPEPAAQDSQCKSGSLSIRRTLESRSPHLISPIDIDIAECDLRRYKYSTSTLPEPRKYALLLCQLEETEASSRPIVLLVSVILPGPGACILRVPVPIGITVKHLAASVLRRSASVNGVSLASATFHLVHEDTGGILFDEDNVWDVVENGSVLRIVTALAVTPTASLAVGTASPPPYIVHALPSAAAPHSSPSLLAASPSPLAAPPAAAPSVEPPLPGKFVHLDFSVGMHDFGHAGAGIVFGLPTPALPESSAPTAGRIFMPFGYRSQSHPTHLSALPMIS